LTEFDLRALLELLREKEVDFVVIGGVAVAAHGLVRGTEDLALVPAPDPDNLRPSSGHSMSYSAREVSPATPSSTKTPSTASCSASRYGCAPSPGYAR
jgi:hypothetical protein